MSELWRINEMAEIVAAALEAAGYRGPPSGRVRPMPDARTIRYYTTLGLVDRPSEIRGRVAFYGRRHVLQLVAIKRLQAAGATLLQVQQTLAGADEKRLERLAGVPASFWRSLAGQQRRAAEVGRMACAERRGPAPQRRDRVGRAGKSPDWQPRGSLGAAAFWLAEPMVAAAAEAEGTRKPQEQQEEHPEADQPAWVGTALHVRLAEGVTLVLEGVQSAQLDDRVMASVLPLADQLTDALIRAGLIRRAGSSDDAAGGP